MLRFCLGAYGRPNHAWMPSLGAGLIRLSQVAEVLFQQPRLCRRIPSPQSPIDRRFCPFSMMDPVQLLKVIRSEARLR